MSAKDQIIWILGLGMMYIFYQIVCILCGKGEAKYKGEEDEKGECHGKGKFTFANGNIYVGEFFHGQFQGWGRMIFKKGGRVFCGQFKDGMSHGKGKDVEGGIEYTGSFEKGLRHGRGKLTFPNGTMYVGDFKAGDKHGKGLIHYADGTKFWGSFFEGLKQGCGISCTKDGVRSYEEWSQGKLVKSSATRPANFPRFFDKKTTALKEQHSESKLA